MAACVNRSSLCERPRAQTGPVARRSRRLSWMSSGAGFRRDAASGRWLGCAIARLRRRLCVARGNARQSHQGCLSCGLRAKGPGALFRHLHCPPHIPVRGGTARQRLQRPQSSRQNNSRRHRLRRRACRLRPFGYQHRGPHCLRARRPLGPHLMPDMRHGGHGLSQSRLLSLGRRGAWGHCRSDLNPDRNRFGPDPNALREDLASGRRE